MKTMKMKGWVKVLIIVAAILLGVFAYVFYKVSDMVTMETGKVNNFLYAGKTGFVNFFVMEYDSGLICFDAGNSIAEVEIAMKELNLNVKDVTHVFLTHSDGDHVNGVEAFPNAKIFLPEKEVGLLDGMVTRKIFFMEGSNKLPVDNYLTMKNQETIMAGEVSVKATSAPGHTPGHTVFLVNDSILFAGDAFHLAEDGTYEALWAPINNDYERAKETAETLRNIPISLVVTAHDGYYRFEK
jgi:hydroxyacylglutathione hydrolase